jgi:hypothetical protein
MQLQDPLCQFEAAVERIESVDPCCLDVVRLTSLMRRAGVVQDAALASMDDRAAARTKGVSVQKERQARVRSRKVAVVPEVAEAVAVGALSPEQGEVLADNAEIADELFAVAPGKTPDELKAEAARLRRNSGESEFDREQRILTKRDVRHWVDGDGVLNILHRLSPMGGASVLAKMRAAEKVLSRAEGATVENHRSDVLTALILGSVTIGKERVVVNTHVDLESLNRGWVEGDGFCEVDGLASIPVRWVQSCFDQAILRVLLTSKNKLIWSGDISKELPERTKEAIRAHNRHRCVRCGARGVDVDHSQARINGGSHDLSNVQTLCEACHGEKTVLDAPWSRKYYGDRRPRAG